MGHQDTCKCNVKGRDKVEFYGRRRRRLPGLESFEGSFYAEERSVSGLRSGVFEIHVSFGLNKTEPAKMIRSSIPFC